MNSYTKMNCFSPDIPPATSSRRYGVIRSLSRHSEPYFLPPLPKNLPLFVILSLASCPCFRRISPLRHSEPHSLLPLPKNLLYFCEQGKNYFPHGVLRSEAEQYPFSPSRALPSMKTPQIPASFLYIPQSNGSPLFFKGQIGQKNNSTSF